MSLRFAAVAVGLVACLSPATPQAQDAVRADAASMQRKILAIVARGEVKPGARPSPLRTSFSDREVNAYFSVYGGDVVPDGVRDPQVAISEGGRVRARAVVDLDTALRTKQRGVLDPLSWLSGKVEVVATGQLQTAGGQGRLSVESATLGGVPVPKALLQELVSYYSRSPQSAKGFSLDEPFELPANIRSVETTRGAATVVQ